jgi:hypothetical protein
MAETALKILAARLPVTVKLEIVVEPSVDEPELVMLVELMLIRLALVAARFVVVALVNVALVPSNKAMVEEPLDKFNLPVKVRFTNCVAVPVVSNCGS